MGVPSLYKWLIRRYPEIRQPLDKNKSHLTDILYLDFNAIIHPCCNKSLGNMEETDTELYKNLISFLDDALDRVCPKKLLYISIDGVAPRAKLNQQRSRRFVHAKEVLEKDQCYFKDTCGATPSDTMTLFGSSLKNEDNFEKSQKLTSDLATCTENAVFDVNSITPGTEFMQRLDAFMQELIAYKISTDERWRNINVIFSGYKVPGEGEQKIMEYIRNHQSSKSSCVIYSPDADLIFLGLTLFDYQVMIFRDEPVLPGEEDRPKAFVLLDIPKLRNLLIKQFKTAIKIPFDHRRFLEDWVMLCFSVGNDFLPCSPSFEIRANALDKLTFILQTIYLKNKSFITDNGKINFYMLLEFFKECAKREDSFITEKRENLFMSRKRMGTLSSAVEEYNLNGQRSKIRFYIEKMNIKSEIELIKACKEYVRGLQWVYSYYFYDIVSWDWYYPYHFAPFMFDLKNVPKFDIDFNYGRPLQPLEQLLVVLPPLSKDLLPSCLASIFESFKEFYPLNFKLDMFQKSQDWQAVAILPFMDTKKITDAFNIKKTGLTFVEAERNLSGFPLFYSRQSKLISKIYPLYVELKTSDNIISEEFTGKVFTTPTFRVLEEEVNKYSFKYINRIVKFSFDQKKESRKSKN